MTAERDTIFALASGALPSAIALVRLSGPDAFRIGANLLNGQIPAHGSAVLREVLGSDSRVVDQAVATAFYAPKSYTGEDTLELSLHGGRYIVEQVYGRLIELGARIAEPGEFTRRAFEAGKLDLTQAEAVADLIDAESDAQHRQALQQLGGSLSDQYDDWRQGMIRALASLEVYIDFPDEGDVGELDLEPVLAGLWALDITMQAALDQSEGAERIREGFLIAIMGPPNAGKSSLLNALAGHEAAIVTDIPGTTRDFVEVRLRVGPYLVRFSDTAGLRETDDAVERIGVERAYKRAEEADLRLWLHPIDVAESQRIDNKSNDISVLTKSDLVENPSVSRETLAISSVTGEGLRTLRREIEERLDQIVSPAITPGLTQLRHRQAIERSLSHLRDGIRKIEDEALLDLAAEDVRFAANAVASLTGRVDIEDVLGSIFADFCIGK
ncbi:MAG: tRNA uridine-5-carboxymethylaminomethyl(34) synthesis GTPase MnmE [Pseudomonadota bacterium]